MVQIITLNLFSSDIGREIYTPSIYDNVVTTVTANEQLGFETDELIAFG